MRFTSEEALESLNSPENINKAWVLDDRLIQTVIVYDMVKKQYVKVLVHISECARCGHPTIDREDYENSDANEGMNICSDCIDTL